MTSIYVLIVTREGGTKSDDEGGNEGDGEGRTGREGRNKDRDGIGRTGKWRAGRIGMERLW